MKKEFKNCILNDRKFNTHIDIIGKASEGWSQPDVVKIKYEGKELIGYRKSTIILGEKNVIEIVLGKIGIALGVSMADTVCVFSDNTYKNLTDIISISVVRGTHEYFINFREMRDELFYDLQKQSQESPLEFAIRNGWELYMYQMFVIDYIVANRDRHGSNLEVLRNAEDKTIRIAPLFDQGVSLLFSTYGEEELIEQTDVMRNFPVNNYIGAKSLEYNLSLIPQNFDLKIKKLSECDKRYIFKDVEKILSKKHIEKIWEMIWKRWCYFEEIRSEKE